MMIVLLQGWTKGVVFVNGVNIGRYWSVGPQHFLYIPAPLLRRGPNTVSQYTNHHCCYYSHQIMVFEQHLPKSPQTITLQDSPNNS